MEAGRASAAKERRRAPCQDLREKGSAATLAPSQLEHWARTGNSGSAEKVVSEMQKAGGEPNTMCLMLVILACLRDNELAKAEHWFKLLVQPRSGTASARAGYAHTLVVECCKANDPRR